MGKKARKTRWRALAIDTGNQSDSEESHTATPGGGKNYHYQSSYASTTAYNNHSHGHNHHYNGYQPASHYGGVYRSYRGANGAGTATTISGGGPNTKYAYSSQGGAPRGRFGHHPHHYHHNHHSQAAECRKDDDTKTTPQSTGSNGIGSATGGTNSDGKITFNEDEYTRITTPRQDVLFKKGYLSKPKAYQTQTSTGASTISTGNSTGNGTPDHQSADGTEGTDLEYESQFVFPNGFVDQNGIYYVNSFEPYPLVVYNPPMCYPEYVSSTRSKRLSTGSLTESTSPHNEETSQELSHSGGETVNYPEFGPGNVYNLVFPGYYGYGVPPEMEISHGEPRKIKKRRRRKLSKPVEDNWTTSSSDDYDESEEMVSEIENRIIQGTHRHRPVTADSPASNTTNSEETHNTQTTTELEPKEEKEAKEKEEKEESKGEVKEIEVMLDVEAIEVKNNGGIPEVVEGTPEEPESTNGTPVTNVNVNVKKVLKADAKEFIPRFFHQPHQPHHQAHHQHRHPQPQFITNLIPLPPSFLPAPHMHILPPPPPQQPPLSSSTTTKVVPSSQDIDIPEETNKEVTTSVIPSTSQPQKPQKTGNDNNNAIVVPSPTPEVVLPSTSLVNEVKVLNKPIDIAKIVSKLEEAAKEQRRSGTTTNGTSRMGTPRSRRNYQRTNTSKPTQPTQPTQSEVKSTKDNFTSTPASNVSSGKNYAQMLSKKSAGTSPMKKYASPAKDNNNISTVATSSQTPCITTSSHKHTSKVMVPATNQSQSQWISVQSRKKRKNNKQCDWDDEEDLNINNTNNKTDFEVKGVSNIDGDGFEAYDVSKLEDVVVVRPETDNNTSVPDVVEDIVETIAVIEETPKQIDQLDHKAAEEEEFDKLIRTLEELEAKTPQKKKPVVNKRVMITDVGVEEVLPLTITEIKDDEDTKPNIKKTKKSKSKTTQKVDISKENEVVEVISEVKHEKMHETLNDCMQPVIQLNVTQDESPDKNKKKKKKKTPKKPTLTLDSTLTPPISMPNTPSTSASVVDESSYNFLLTDSLLEEERTNLEVSEELDKIIQRGMFTSLEEKIKSLNITAMNDGFFKSMTSFVDNTTKTGKEDDLTTILTKTTNIFKAKRPGNGAEVPATTGSFLDLASLHEDPGISTHGGRKDEYPITKAVKDWMVRTRETTPEIELLKSPRTILKEISEVITTSNANIKESWSLTPESSFEDEDLLECWDDLEVTTDITSNNHIEVMGDATTEKQKQIEASLEVYESMYGKNEDFKLIKAEIEERKRNGTLPKHGGLPYRAVCCSVM
ncbi:uncharacterized protein [Atheta coriaria]|uniref:uncharacterized protein n=1 Tax=Dalotia coriaria TaxID=877792 RepID=UPI0031F3E488